MNRFDLVIVVVMVAAAIGGFRVGFVARVLSWAGLGLGVFVGVKLVHVVAPHTRSSSAPVALLVVAAVLIGPGLVGLAAGLAIGSSLSDALPLGPLRVVDRLVGAVVGVLGVLAVLWLMLPTLGSSAGAVSRAALGSKISRFVANDLPRPPNTVEALRTTVSRATGPLVFNGLHPAEDTGPPPATVPLAPAVVAQVSASTVKVTGEACNQIQDGSGFTVAHDLVVTNAHVVAGEPNGSTRVVLNLPNGGTSSLAATVVLYDPNRDLALLSVPDDPEAPLPVGVGASGQVGAVFGHPGGQQALAVVPAQIAQEVTAVGQDLYATHSTRRDVFVLASDLMPGDSGGALVTGGGTVVGVAFAIAPDRPGTSYALSSSELKAVLAEPRSGAVSTEACLAG
ncbi:MAG TPA: MarP family serine protease [Acidimicrobiales bacterium]|nr:MarP family serine protease [Acidimicrobiales bacterium]